METTMCSTASIVRVTKKSNENSKSKNKLQHSNRNRVLRFAPGTKIIKRDRTIKKRKHSERSSLSSSDNSNSNSSSSSSDTCDPARWWTKQELKEIQESCAFAVKTRDFMLSPATLSMDNTTTQEQKQTQTQDQDYCDSADFAELDRFAERNRKRRKLVRWQMYETTKVVQQYARANLDSGDELLSELLQSYSKPMELDAIESGLRRRHEIEILQIDNSDNTTDNNNDTTDEQQDNCNNKGNCNYVTPVVSERWTQQRSDKQEMGVTMAVARLFLERSLGAGTTSPSSNTNTTTSTTIPQPQQRVSIHGL